MATRRINRSAATPAQPQRPGPSTGLLLRLHITAAPDRRSCSNPVACNRSSAPLAQPIRTPLRPPHRSALPLRSNRATRRINRSAAAPARPLRADSLRPPPWPPHHCRSSAAPAQPPRRAASRTHAARPAKDGLLGLHITAAPTQSPEGHATNRQKPRRDPTRPRTRVDHFVSASLVFLLTTPF
jgi:hypothetical protein